MPLSILHFSDLHLDTSFAESRLPPEIGRRCRESLRNTVVEIINLARERNAGAVTIAGDLFENERVQPETLKFLAEHFSRLAPTPIFIAPGLSDHAGPHSAYRMLRWPPNVHVFLNNTLSERSLSSEYELWSAARLHDNDQENVLEGFVAASSGKIPILLLHAQVAPPAREERDQPTASRGDMLTLDGIAHSGFSAALIGRQHERFTFSNRKCTIVCPGNPQPLGFDDASEHGAAWIVLSPGNDAFLEWLPLKSESSKGLDFKIIDISVDREKSSATLIDTITQALRYQSLRDCIVRVRLVGSASPAIDIDAKTLGTQIEHHCGYLHIENHTPPSAFQLEKISQFGNEPTVRGAFVREMIAQRSAENASQKLHQEALLYGIQAFEQENIVLR